MNANHTAMQSTLNSLERKGFKWRGQDSESIYLSKGKGFQTLHAQVDCFDGVNVTVNGDTLKDFIEWLKNF